MRRLALLFFLTAASVTLLGTTAQAPAPKPVYLSYAEAEPLLRDMADGLPPELQKLDPQHLAAAWPDWVRGRDAEVRARLAGGDLDSLANLTMFGTSFTPQPRFTPDYIVQVKSAHPGDPEASAHQLDATLKARAADLARALASPGGNERLLFMRRVLARQGLTPAGAGRAKLQEFLLANVARVREEYTRFARELEEARKQGNTTDELAQRAVLFRDRGISLDTSLLPNYALEESLAEMKEMGLLPPGGVRRVAIVGPGLDFVDKSEGYDFYPQQTVQPFAVMDSLLRLGLAKPGQLQVTTLDISERVNQHIEGARARARQGAAYVVQLPRDAKAGWKPGAVAYWEHFGDQLGSPVQAVEPPAGLGDVKVRAVRFPPAVVLQVTAADLNVVYQRLPLPPGEGFDLVIATNILVYYDVFEQELALANVGRMLAPGGILLSNDILLELPGARLHGVGYHTTVYSDRKGDGDQIFWYRLQP
ncbi:MAG TPA: class I SAM-dependent methyltransferase [Terriglobales bacterium]|nr:class I SAM-dependent methyltransferase [Terriglobales bacterium]